MSTALTGAAGEHYVAYLLSRRGFSVGLTRGGSPHVDIMISDSTGSCIAIQVKTSSGARREYKRRPENNRWEFDVSSKAGTLAGDKLYYAFVDMKGGNGTPDVFVIPSIEIQKRFANTSYKRPMFWLQDSEKELWFERWDLLTIS